jgi:pimeloyl-ACP methyl ester carboxylesterase
MNSLKFFFRGLPFLIRSVGFRFPSSIQIEEEILPSKLVLGKNYRFKYFFPKNTSKENNPTIFLTHGMSGFGIDDPRMFEVAISLASGGYTVVVPEFEEVKALKITPESVRNIKDVFLIILDHKKINTKDVGFFSISFSAGYGLVALTDPEIATRVKSIIAIGGFADLLETCSFAIGNYLTDDYPSNILFYNYLHLLYDNTSELEEVFYQAALDNGFSRKGKEQVAPILYEKLSKGHKEIFDRAKVDANFRKELASKISESYAEPANSISPIYYIEKIKSPVCLIHGKDDNVIPENQSIKLASRLNEFNLDFCLELTGLLSHGDKVPFWKQLGSLPGLSSAFGYFFEKLNERK